MKGKGIKTRVFGSLLGGSVCDARGLPVEFMRCDAFHEDRGFPAEKYPAW